MSGGRSGPCPYKEGLGEGAQLRRGRSRREVTKGGVETAECKRAWNNSQLPAKRRDKARTEAAAFKERFITTFPLNRSLD